MPVSTTNALRCHTFQDTDQTGATALRETIRPDRWVGGAIVGLFTGGFSIGFNLTSFIVAVVGAVLFLAVVNLIFRKR